MWTNNMKKLIAEIFTDAVSNGVTFTLTNNTEYKPTTNWQFPFGKTVTTTSTYIISNESTNITSIQAGGFGLLVGIGDTEPTVDDYALANQTVLTSISFQCVINGSLFPTITHTMRNNSGGTLVITEIGLYFGIANGQRPALLGRKLLDTPVTMEDGEAYTFQYNIDLRNLAE